MLAFAICLPSSLSKDKGYYHGILGIIISHLKTGITNKVVIGINSLRHTFHSSMAIGSRLSVVYYLPACSTIQDRLEYFPTGNFRVPFQIANG